MAVPTIHVLMSLLERVEHLQRQRRQGRLRTDELRELLSELDCWARGYASETARHVREGAKLEVEEAEFLVVLDAAGVTHLAKKSMDS